MRRTKNALVKVDGGIWILMALCLMAGRNTAYD